jgi:hypothetical protein
LKYRDAVSNPEYQAIDPTSEDRLLDSLFYANKAAIVLVCLSEEIRSMRITGDDTTTARKRR